MTDQLNLFDPNAKAAATEPEAPALPATETQELAPELPLETAAEPALEPASALPP